MTEESLNKGKELLLEIKRLKDDINSEYIAVYVGNKSISKERYPELYDKFQEVSKELFKYELKQLEKEFKEL